MVIRESMILALPDGEFVVIRIFILCFKVNQKIKKTHQLMLCKNQIYQKMVVLLFFMIKTRH